MDMAELSVCGAECSEGCTDMFVHLWLLAGYARTCPGSDITPHIWSEKSSWNQLHCGFESGCVLNDVGCQKQPYDESSEQKVEVRLLRCHKRCLRCNGYRHRKWTRWHEFKSWTRIIAFHIALIPLGKVWIQLFSLQLWVNSRAD